MKCNSYTQCRVPPFSKFPELLSSFKTLLGFKDPGLPEQLPTTSPAPPYAPKDRVTEFAAEIGKSACSHQQIEYLSNGVFQLVIC